MDRSSLALISSFATTGSSELCKRCRIKCSLPIPSFHPLPEERLPKRAKVLGSFTSVINADSAVVAETIGGQPVIPNKENIDPVLTKDQKTREPMTGETVLFVVDGDDTHGSVCSDGSDLSENLTLAQMLTRESQHNEEHLEESPDQSAIINTDDVSESQCKVQQLSHLPIHVEPIMTSETGRDYQEEIGHSGPQSDFSRKILSDIESTTTCFICGCSFDRLSTGYKGRLSHIKRCSKKNGVNAHLVKVNNDEEDFQPSETETILKPDNPYTKVSSVWHAGAEQQLKLAAKQTMMSLPEAPSKSINNVLMAGARRMLLAGNVLPLAVTNKQQKGSRRNSWLGSRRNQANSHCPFFKKIPGTDFVCDGFVYAQDSLTKNYFLTHFHSDHYGGIDKSWSAGIIYCSLPTANLVAQQLGVDKKYLHPLSMNVPVVIESQGKPVKVTLLDANHCPGAVMFLFHVGRRHILHVGDFRWNRDRMYADLKDFISLKCRLDDLFLDTTYCNEKYHLPTQDEAIAAAVLKAEEEVDSCRKTGRRLLMLFGAYTIGKERIYLAVAEKLGMKVYVDKTRHKILSALNWPPEKLNLLTTNKETSCLWVVPLGHINFNKLTHYADGSCKVLGKRKFDKIVGFRPTGWSITGCTGASILNSRTSGIFTVHGVPYSEHSSFPELVDCLQCLKPRRIIPTVAVSKSDEQIAVLLRELKKREPATTYQNLT